MLKRCYYTQLLLQLLFTSETHMQVEMLKMFFLLEEKHTGDAHLLLSRNV